MKEIKFACIVVILGFVIFTSCSKDENIIDPVTIDPPPTTHYTVKFGAGLNWDLAQPITGQDLLDHSNYQFELFNSGVLKMAGFLLDTDEARYFQGVSTENEIDTIIVNDPAMIDSTLSVLEKEAISIVVEQIPDSITSVGKSYFIVEYTQGTAWDTSKKLWEQDLVEHQNYIETKFGEKFVLRGIQYLNVDKAMYIVLAQSITDVQSFTNNDPAVINNVFANGVIVPYTLNVEQL